MAGKDYGGKMSFTLNDGTIFRKRGTFRVMTAGRENEAVTNQDGSNDRVMTLTAYGFEVTFADDGQDMEALLKAPRFDARFVEDDTGVTHVYTSAFFVGTPTTDRVNGEVTGLSGAADEYIRKAV